MLGNLGAQAVTKELSMATSGVTSMVGELNDSSKAWQTFDGNMRMIGKSENEIEGVKNSLQDFATQTIYSASDMASTYAQMASVGYDNSEQLVKGMGGIAAAAENPAQAMKTLSQQMTQALTKPEMQWQDFRLMLEQSPAGMSAVAKEMGMSLDDLVLAIQDGEISSQDFADAVATVGTNADFSKMATEFKTVGQAMDGLREGVANKLMPAFEVLQTAGIEAISGIADAVDTINVDNLVNVAKQAVDVFKNMADQIKIFFLSIYDYDNFESIKQAFSDVANGISTAFEKAGVSMEKIGNNVGEVISYIGRDRKSVV